MARYSTAGTVFQINAVNVDGVESISGPTGEKPEIPTTSLADIAATSVSGLPDYGEVTLTVFDNPSDGGNGDVLENFQATNTVLPFRIILPFSGTGNSINFNGYVKNWALDAQGGAAGRYNATIRVTGAVVRT